MSSEADGYLPQMGREEYVAYVSEGHCPVCRTARLGICGNHGRCSKCGSCWNIVRPVAAPVHVSWVVHLEDVTVGPFTHRASRASMPMGTTGERS